MKTLDSRANFERAVRHMKQDRILIRLSLCFFVAVCIASAWLYFRSEVYVDPEWMFLIPITALTPALFFRAVHRARYKTVLIGAVVKDRFPAWSYRANGDVKLADVLKTRLVPKSFSSVRSEDSLTTTHRGCPVRVVEIQLTPGASLWKDSRDGIGALLLEATIPRTHKPIVMLPKTVGDCAWVGLPLVPSDSDESFAAYFDVYSKAPEDVARLVTTGFRRAAEKLLAARDGAELRLALVGGRVSLLALGGHDRLEPPDFGALDESRIADQIARELRRFEPFRELVDTLMGGGRP